MSKPHRTILVIDDVPKHSDDYEHQLRQDVTFSYRVLTEQYNTQALALCRSQQIDGILLELYSTQFNSLNFLDQLKEQMGENCPPIVVIGSGDAEIAVWAFKHGAMDYLVKDRITPDDLRVTMRSAIENAELRRELQRSQEQFQTSVENMLDCFGIFSSIRDESGQILDFRIDYLNGAACENNRMPKAMQIGRGLCEVLPAHRESGLFDEYCQLVETGEPLIKDSLVYEDTYGGEHRLIRAFEIRATKLNDGFVASWRDITDRKQMEVELSQTVAALQQQQNRLQRLIDTAPIGIGIGSANGEVRVINDAMLHLHGYTRDEFEQQGMNWRDFALPEDADRTEQAMAQLRQQGFLPPEEKELLRRDGSRVPIWISATQWMDDMDEHVAFAVDLTQQKQAEAALKDSQQRYRQLAEAMPQMVWTADATGFVNYWNQRWYEYTGLSEAESMDLAGISTVHPDDRDRTLEQWRQSLASGEPFEIEYRICHWDGEYHWFISRAIPTRDSQNQVTGWIGTITNIDHQKRLEVRLLSEIADHQCTGQELRATNQKVNRILESMTDAFVSLDRDWRITYVNQITAQINQVAPEELIGRSHWEVWEDTQGSICEENYRRAIAEQVPVQFEYFYKSRQRWYEVHAYPSLDGLGIYYRDISDRKASEISLQENQVQLQQQLAEIEAIYQSAPIGLAVLDADLRFMRINQRLAEINGLPVEAHIGHTVRELLPGLMDSAEQLLLSILETGEPLLNVEIRGETPAQPGVQRTWLEHFLPLKRGDRVIGINIVCEEITERIQAEAALRQSEEHFRTLADNISQLAWMTDENGWIFWYNQRWFDYTGTTLEEMQGWGWQKVHHPDHVERVVEKISRCFETGETWEDTFPLRGRDGQYRWFLSRAIPIRDAQGQVLRWFGTNTDITDLRQTEMALQQTTERLNIALKSAPLTLFNQDLDLRYTWIYNPTQNFSEEEVIGRRDEELVSPDTAARLTQLKQQVLDTSIGLREEVKVTKDGQTAYYDLTIDPLRDNQNAIVGITCAAVDISDRKQAEEALRQSEERYRCLAELIPQLVWTAAADGALLDVNQRWLEFTGFTFEQVRTLGWQPLIHPDDLPALSQQWTVAMQTGSPYQSEGRMRRADGVYLWHLHQAIPQKNEQGQIVKWFGTATDIEVQKQLEAERDRLFQEEQAAREAAERANRIKDEFLAVLSHELRSPLNPILGWAKLLQTHKLDESRTIEALATIERNAKLQTQLIDDLLDVAKILRGKLSLNIAPVNLSFVIEAAIDTVRTAAVAKAISLHAVLPKIGQVSGDAARLQQVVWNLLSNAIKFTPKHGRVDIRLEQVGNQAQMTVSDTGKGINPDFLPHLFESFRQEDASTTRKYGGLGLGLAIVRQLVEAHGGTILADSSGEGMGAMFTVRLPLLNVEPETKQIDELAQQDLNLTGIRVLTVDDDPDARELLMVLLSQYGAEVLTVASAAEALDTLESFQPTVLISDIGMPDMDGYALIQQIRALPAEQGGQLPAIALTAYAREEEQQRSLKSGYQQHVTKPIEPEQLVQAVVALAQNKNGV